MTGYILATYLIHMKKGIIKFINDFVCTKTSQDFTDIIFKWITGSSSLSFDDVNLTFIVWWIFHSPNFLTSYIRSCKYSKCSSIFSRYWPTACFLSPSLLYLIYLSLKAPAILSGLQSFCMLRVRCFLSLWKCLVMCLLGLKEGLKVGLGAWRGVGFLGLGAGIGIVF